jgi:GT2 family glycosyltransferase
MFEEAIDTSVIICAYTENRWDIFVRAVESAVGQEPPPEEIVIVIDHNPRLLERTRGRFPDLIVTENTEAQGLSGARNSGIAASHGQLIAFLDDDAIAEPNWLERLVRCCDDPQVLGVGGCAEPMWIKRPKWFPDEFLWVVGCSHTGLPTSKGEVRNPTGGNMCLRRQAFEQVGSFRVGMGRIGTIPMGCEETELCIRMRQLWPGRFFLHDPGSRIYHQVTGARASWAYFRSRCYAEGLSKAQVSRLVGANDGLSAERDYVFKVLPVGVLRGVGDALFHSDMSGLGRAGAIVAGVLITAAGYAVGRCSALLHTDS